MNAAARAAIALHRRIYSLSGGRIGGRMGGAPNLLLTTRGRRSGKERTVPLLYLEDGDSLIVVASAGGQETHPAWYLNLVAEPDAQVQIGRQVRPVRARTLDAAARAVVWPRVTATYAGYERYAARTEREIPLVALDPR